MKRAQYCTESRAPLLETCEMLVGRSPSSLPLRKKVRDPMSEETRNEN